MPEDQYILEDTIHQPWGYIATIVWINEPGGIKRKEPLKYKVALNCFGDYIGEPRWARKLHRRGIFPEARPGTTVASYGYSSTERKWYGWSHRAMAGFKPGSKVRKGDVICGLRWPDGYVCRNNEEAKEMAMRFAEEVS